MRKINEIIIHCSDTPTDRNVRAKDIDYWHKQRGWKGIGYHFVITIDGTIECGRMVDEVGAHCEGHNTRSVGICLIGCGDYTSEQYTALEKLLRSLKEQFTGIRIYGHNSFSPKTCPNFNVTEFLIKKHI